MADRTFELALESYDNSPDTPIVRRRAVFASNFPGYGRIEVRLIPSAFAKLAERGSLTVTLGVAE